MKYEIKGDSLPVLICKLNAGDEILTQAGGMSWHTEGVSVKTKGKGGLGKMLGRAFAGESMFQNIYSASRDGEEIAFASSFPGSILPIKVSRYNELIIQKRAFLASETTVDTSMYFQKKLGAGFFGGEGFILQELSGRGIAFLEVDGDAIEMNLAPGEVIKVDTGNLVGFENSVRYEVESVKGLGNILFGGEGLFLTKLTGPGKIILQTMNINEFALDRKSVV